MVHRIISEPIFKRFFTLTFASVVSIFRQRQDYCSGQWCSKLPVHSGNVECNFHLAKILEFMECPQYLRKALFPLQKTLQYAGNFASDVVFNVITFHFVRLLSTVFPIKFRYPKSARLSSSSTCIRS